jgi:cytochrome b561
VTPRATDWGLALLVGLLFATGMMSLFAGRSGDAWVFAVHGAGGFALGGMLVWKGRRVLRRLVRPWDRRTAAGAGAAAFVAVSLVSGWAWSSGAQLSFAGYNLLNWHFALGTALTLVVLGHALLRAKPLRRRDLAGRRQFLTVGALALGSYAAWWIQRPVAELLEIRGAKRRFTGSYERSSFTGNDFPTTSHGCGSDVDPARTVASRAKEERPAARHLRRS